MQELPSSEVASLSPSRPPWAWRRLVVVASCILVAASVLAAWADRWACDDAFISFRYADNLARGWGLVWNVGERVEGYTNLLWTLILVPAAAAGIDLPLASEILGIASFIILAVILACWWRSDPRPAVPIALWVTFAMHDMALWATGGLETMSFAAAAAGMGLLLFGAAQPDPRREIYAGMVGVVLWLLRPDGILIAGTLAAWYVGGRLRTDRRASLAALLRIGGPLVCAVAGATAFRVLYYGDFVPNTFYAKNTGQAYWGSGLTYLGLLLSRNHVLVFALALGMVCAVSRGPRQARGAAGLLAAAAVFTLYVVRSGGDFMFGRRLLPVVPLGLMALERMTGRLASQRRRVALAVVLGALAALPLPIYAWWGRQGRIADVADEPSFYPSEVVKLRRLQGEVLASTFQGIDATFMMEGGLCMLAYYSHLPRIVDINGLTDRTIARTRTETRGRPGHEKRPTPAYLVERRVHLLIRNEFPIRDRGPGTLSIGRLVPLRWLLPDEEIMKVLAQRPGIHMVPPEVGHSLR
jgi:arabinofuranosyltransferase